MAGVKGRSGGPRANNAKSRVVGSVRWQREQRHERRAWGGRVPSPPPARVVVEKPADLPAGPSAVWDELAPHAIEAGTLTPASLWAFRNLLDVIVLHRAMLSQIRRHKRLVDGNAAHPLLTRLVAFQVRVEAGLSRFCLIPMGKGMVAAEQPADEFAEFDEPLSLVRGGKA